MHIKWIIAGSVAVGLVSLAFGGYLWWAGSGDDAIPCGLVAAIFLWSAAVRWEDHRWRWMW